MRTYIFDLLIVSTSGFAIWRGGAPERIVGVAFLAAYVATLASYAPSAVRFGAVESSVFAIDVMLFAALLWIALRADRGWTLVVAALQLNAVGAHIVKLMAPDTIRVTYAVLLAAWAWPAQIVLAVGTWRHVRRLSARGGDRSWSITGRPPY